MQHAIGEHALLADGRAAALVDPDGNIAWLCWPRVDSAPCLLSILDDDAGGRFVVAPEHPLARVVERAYQPGTLILRTTWSTPTGELTVHDALACDGAPRLVRTVHARGTVRVAARVALAPDAGLAAPQPVAAGEALRVRADRLDVVVRAPAPWTIDARGTAVCQVDATASPVSFVLGPGDAPAGAPCLDGTRDWFARRLPAARSLIPSELAARTMGVEASHAALLQSAAVLAGLRQRGGGIVAAPTTSLPQWPHSSRTWDYRYSWLRDTALAGLAMLRCGLLDDAAGLGEFVGAAVASLPPAALRRVDGSPPPPERELAHLDGHRGARPVRVGNAASEQSQLDVVGEVLELASALADRDALPALLRDGVARVADWTAEHWEEPDHGIWEIRGAPRHYTHSRVMAWAGLVQAAELAERGVVAGRAAAWRRAAGLVRARVLRGAGALTLREGGGGPDSALAQLALTGCLPGHDLRLQATLDSITLSLDRGGLIERHLPAEDPRADPCAPFVFPTFWVAQALRACGRDGSAHFAAAASSRGPLDLFGEVADPADHSPLGNYPQVQSHAAFVLAAIDPGGV